MARAATEDPGGIPACMYLDPMAYSTHQTLPSGIREKWVPSTDKENVVNNPAPPKPTQPAHPGNVRGNPPVRMPSAPPPPPTKR
jgi:hypothetical protein